MTDAALFVCGADAERARGRLEWRAFGTRSGGHARERARAASYDAEGDERRVESGLLAAASPRVGRAVGRAFGARGGREAHRRARAGARDHDVRARARAERRRRRDRRGYRAPARVGAAHRQHRSRPAQLGVAARRRRFHDPRRAARRSPAAHAAARDQHRPVEHRLALQRVRLELLGPLAQPARPRGGGRERGAGDRVADRRLLRRRGARARVVIHPRRRGRGDRVRVYRERLRREPDRLAGCVRRARDPGLLPRVGALGDRPRAAARRPEPPRSRRRRSR